MNIKSYFVEGIALCSFAFFGIGCNHQPHSTPALGVKTQSAPVVSKPVTFSKNSEKNKLDANVLNLGRALNLTAGLPEIPPFMPPPTKAIKAELRKSEIAFAAQHVALRTVLREAKNISPEKLNQAFPQLGDWFKRYYLLGLSTLVKAISMTDPRKYSPLRIKSINLFSEFSTYCKVNHIPLPKCSAFI